MLELREYDTGKPVVAVEDKDQMTVEGLDSRSVC